MIILASQISYKITPVLATQEDEAAFEIKKVLEGTYHSLALRDLETMMQYVSVNYSATVEDGTVIDYTKFKARTKEFMDRIFNKYTNYSISDIKMFNLNIEDNKANVEMEYSWKGFNLDTLLEDSGKKRRAATLVKENGLWKITQWRRLSD